MQEMMDGRTGGIIQSFITICVYHFFIWDGSGGESAQQLYMAFQTTYEQYFALEW